MISSDSMVTSMMQLCTEEDDALASIHAMLSSIAATIENADKHRESALLIDKLLKVVCQTSTSMLDAWVANDPRIPDK